MRTELADALEDVRIQLELDHKHSAAPLPVRARALKGARAAGDRNAERQALIDLAAACITAATNLPAPRKALAEIHTPADTTRRTPRTRHAA
jgi:hypothetical protein